MTFKFWLFLGVLFVLSACFRKTFAGQVDHELDGKRDFERDTGRDGSSLVSLETDLGTLIGHKKIVQNRTINVFYGVPYAEAPVGKLRFRRTRLIRRFPHETYNALRYKAHCAQKPAKKYDEDEVFSEVKYFFD